MKFLFISNQIKKGLQLVIVLAVLFLNFGMGGASKAYAATCDPDPANNKTLIVAGGGGTFSAAPLPDCDGGTHYSVGTVVTLTVNTVDPGYTFSDWRDGSPGINYNTQLGTSSSLNVTMTGNKNIIVKFTPPNDSFANAKTVSTTLPYTDTVYTTGAADAGEGSGGGPTVPNTQICDQHKLNKPLRDVWYKYTPEVNKQVTIDTIGSTPPSLPPNISQFDTYLAIWTGPDINNLSFVACDDDTNSLLQSSVSIQVTAGVTYYIQASQWNGYLADPYQNPSGGNLKLKVNTGNKTEIWIGSDLKGIYPLVPDSSEAHDYATILAGPVKAISTTGDNIFTTQVVTSGGSYNELAGYPVSQFTTEYWFPYYDHGFPNVSGDYMRTWILVGNPSATQTATVQIYIGGVLQVDPEPTHGGATTFSIAPGANITPRWKGLIGGPVQVKSTNGVNIFASERVFTVPYDSFNEVMGYPANQFTTEYWFTWYDTRFMDTYLLVGNTSGSQTANVDIYIGPNKMGSYAIAPNSTIKQRYNDILDGPVRVVSTNGVNIVTSEFTQSGTENSFNEVMGYPFNQFTTEYWFPYYDHGYPNVSGNTMRTWILVGNPSPTVTAQVSIYIAGVLKDSFSIAPGANVTPRWKGDIAGPVQVISTNGAAIFTSERVFTVPTDAFNEFMGIPASQFTTEYWFTWYDTIYMNTKVMIGKP